MSGLIAFVLCLAVMAFAASVKLGFALLAMAVALLASYLAWLFARLFIGP